MMNSIRAHKVAYNHILKEIGIMLSTLPLAALFAGVISVVESIVGMPLVVYLFWAATFLIDWFTGLRAARAKGEAYQSHLLPSTFISASIYTFILAGFHIVGEHVGDISIGQLFSFNWIAPIKWTFFFAVWFTQLYSIFENKRETGSKVAPVVLRLMDGLLSRKWRDMYDSIRKR